MQSISFLSRGIFEPNQDAITKFFISDPPLLDRSLMLGRSEKRLISLVIRILEDFVIDFCMEINETKDF